MSIDQTPDPEAFRDFEHAGWTSNVSEYEAAFARITSQAIGPLLDAVDLRPGARMLDVATGPGYVAAAAAERGARAVGVDFSAPMVARARTIYPTVEFQEGDAEAISFPDGSFDAVVMNFGMLHLARPERAMTQAGRVLKPGGMAIFREWIEAPVFDTLRRTIGAWLVPPGKSLERHVTEDERKLTAEDIARIRRLCPQLTVERHILVARIGRLLPPPVNSRPSLLEKVDWGLFQMVPWLRGLDSAE